MTIVWDVFPYWREQWAVDARLKLWAALAPEVEYRPTALLGDRTFRGEPLVTQWPRGTEQTPVVVWTTALNAAGPWEREKQQRDAISAWNLRSLMADEDLVLIADADELVDPRALDRILDATATGPVKLRMAMYVAGTRWRDPTPWRHSAACRARDLPEHVTDQLRDVRTLPQVEDAGWHLTYYGTDEDVDAKLRAFSHAEVDTPEMRAQLAHDRERGPAGWLDDPLTGPLADILAEVPAC